jgi:multidrug efflux pump
LGPKIAAGLEKLPQLADVNLDQQQNGLETNLVIDRATAAQFGLIISQIDNTLYDAFGQRQVTTIYAAQNQYHVVMEVAPEFSQNPETLNQIYVSTSGGAASGTQGTQPLAGTVVYKAPTKNNSSAGATAPQIAGDRARNAANNSLANTGRIGTSTGTAVSTLNETMVPLSAFANFCSGQYPARGQSPKSFRGIDDLIQPRAGRLPQRRDRGDREANAITMIDFVLDAERSQNLSSREAYLRGGAGEAALPSLRAASP